MDSAESFFSPDYDTARRRFREAVAARQGRLDSLPLDPQGPAGEDLTIDIGWFGAARPHSVLMHSSGVHGVEGFAGSAIQLHWLSNALLSIPQDGAIAMVHVVNPFGMAWLRRFNENNVDLNRNFLAPDEAFDGAPEGYQNLNEFLNPASAPCSDWFYLRALLLVARHGLPTVKQAMAGGQYRYPKGLFFGGRGPEAGPKKLREYLAAQFASTRRIVGIDVHTGLGRFGKDQMLVDRAEERAGLNRTMAAAYPGRVQALDTTGVAYDVRGAHHNMYYHCFKNADVYFASQEFGTYNPVRVLDALRAENRWHHYGSGTVDHVSKTRLREVFNPADASWRRPVVQRGAEVLQQGLKLAFGN
ncbi:MAG: DUF2817 domain-containing protein [Acidobacteriota bacterium]